MGPRGGQVPSRPLPGEAGCRRDPSQGRPGAVEPPPPTAWRSGAFAGRVTLCLSLPGEQVILGAGGGSSHTPGRPGVTFRWTQQPAAPRSLSGGASLGRVASHVSLVRPCLVAERPAPPRELLVPQAEVTARSLRLQWVPGSDGASPIRYFTVQVRELPRGQWRTYSSSVSHGATACTVERYQARRGTQSRSQGPAVRGPRPSAGSRPQGQSLTRTSEGTCLLFRPHPVYRGPTAPSAPPPQPFPRSVLQTGSAPLAGTPQAPGRRGRGDRDSGLPEV